MDDGTCAVFLNHSSQALEADMPEVSETKIIATKARVSSRELDGSTGRGWASDADVGMIAKLLMLSTVAGASPMAGAAFGLQ